MTTTEILSELRSQYNCFDEMEEPVYHALSKAIKAVSAQPHDYSDGFVDGYKNGVKDTQPERIRCKDCNHYDTHDRRCKHWNHGVKETDWCSRAEEPEDIPMEYFESGGR